MKKIFYLLFAIIVFCILLALAIIEYSKKSYDTADSAIVLGAAAWDSKPSPVFKARIDHAIDLYKEDKIQKIYFTGGTDNPSQLTEGEAGKEYALSNNVDLSDIAIETTSQTTMQNLRNISDKIKAEESILIVTDPLHEYRSMKMAESLGIDVYPSPTPHTQYISWKTKFPFLARETYFMIVFWIFGI